MGKLIKRIGDSFSLIVLLSFYSCSNSQFDAGVNGKDWECESVELFNSIDYVDGKSSFRIQLPHNFWTEENLLDSIHGVVGVDSTKSQDETTVISIVTLSKNGKSFYEYVKGEFEIIKDRDNLEIIDSGRSLKFQDSTYWFLIRNEGTEESTSHELIFYQNQSSTDKCFIIHGIAFGEFNWEKRLCMVGKCLYSFEQI